MNSISRYIVTALLFPFASAGSAATLDTLTEDGLYTWRVAASDNAPEWCCFRWNNDSPVRGSCDLDGPTYNFGTIDDERINNGKVQIYAIIENGVASRIRTLSLQCPVTSRQAIHNLGEVATPESLVWLQQQVQPDTDVVADALASIAVHRGEAATRYLVEKAATGESTQLRKDAIFWMGMVRIAESAAAIEQLMFTDGSADIRKHAGFVIAQSAAANRADLLIRQGRKDTDAEVRSQAWFWLAETGSAAAEAAIHAAMRDDPDDDVREAAVFALAQLPGERAVDALFNVLGDRKLPQPIRKQALFWLAQSDSTRAHDYLGNLLANGH